MELFLPEENSQQVQRQRLASKTVGNAVGWNHSPKTGGWVLWGLAEKEF
jgi:hypothetical protein